MTSVNRDGAHHTGDDMNTTHMDPDAIREYRSLLRGTGRGPQSTRPGRILRIQNVRAAMRMLPRPHRVLMTRHGYGDLWFHVVPDVGFDSWATRDLYELERFVRAHAAPMRMKEAA